MYKHDCVVCLREHYLKCPFFVSWFDRFFGTDKVKYCPEYMKRLEKK